MRTRWPRRLRTVAWSLILPMMVVLGRAPGAGMPSERERTGAGMLAEVDASWRRGAAAVDKLANSEPAAAETAEIERRLAAIRVPSVNFNNLPLSRALMALGALGRELDRDGGATAGINLVLVDPQNSDPVTNLTVHGLPLGRILALLVESVGFEHEIRADAVIVRPAGGPVALETRFFPVSRPTVLRLQGRASAAAAAPAAVTSDEGAAIRAFLQLAGVPFDATPGSGLAFDGSQLVVTQTPRQLDRIARILRRYHSVRQVEIEAKFMEVQAGGLEEFGVQWTAATKASQRNGTPAAYSTAGVNRTLAGAFRNTGTTQQISVTGPDLPPGGIALPTNPPGIPGGVPLGAGAGALAEVSGVVGEFDVNAVIRALAQRTGTELLSAPRLTVVSGSPATITVAQEMRYPQSYGEIQSQVGTGSISGGGSAGVSITSGTPQDFAVRNVGVELRVTPTVEEDDHSISLELHPRVTEFEGFVEYGGPSIAISGGTTVTVPPGFYQPIFSVREVATRVTLWDGATLVMGGLTREDVKKVRDRVPLLGSLPLVGRLFRSEGESAQKRNLLIFVTANLVNPGGVPRRSEAVPGGER